MTEIVKNFSTDKEDLYMVFGISIAVKQVFRNVVIDNSASTLQKMYRRVCKLLMSELPRVKGDLQWNLAG